MADLISEVIDPKALQQVAQLTKEVEDLVKTIASAADRARASADDLSQSKTYAQYNRNVRTAVSETGSLIITTEKLKATKAQLNSIEAAGRREAAALNKEIERSIKLNAELENDYLLLSKAYLDAAAKAKQYAASLGLQHKATIAAVADAQQLYQRLNAIDRLVGDHRRNIGNYESALSGLNGGYSNLRTTISQFAGELPNIGLGLRTFAISLSNQFQGLFQAIAQVRAQNAALRAEGKPTESVAKQIAGSIFNWQTALLALVAAGVAVINYTSKSSDENKKYADSIKEVTNALQEQIKAQNQSVRLEGNRQNLGAAAAKRRLDLLEAQRASEGEIAKARNEYYDLQKRELENDRARYQAIKDRVNEVGNEFRAREKLAGLEEGYYNKFFQPAVQQVLRENLRISAEEAETQAKAIVETFRTERSVIGKDYRDQITQIGEEIKDLESRRDVDNAKAASDRQRRLDKELEKLRKLQEEAAKLANVMAIVREALAAGQNIFPVPDEELYQGPLRALEESIKQVDIQEQKRLALLNQSYAAGITATEDYERQKAEITRKYAIERAKLTVDFLQTEVNNEHLTSDQKLSIQKQLNEALAALGKARAKEEKSNNKDAVKDAQKTARDIQTAFEAASAVISSVFGIIGDRMDANLERFRAMEDAINSQRDAEIEAVNQSVLSQEERDKKIAEIEARARARQVQLEQEEIAARRRKAAFDKAAAIAQIILNTAQAVTAALTSIPPNVPLAIANGVIGAAQLARAIAAPLPQYAEGTENHPGGPALYGEAGPELVMEPGKRPRLVETPTISNLSAGTRVIPEKKLATLGFDLLNAYNPVRKQEANREMLSATDKMRKDIVRAINQNGYQQPRRLRSSRFETYINNWIGN